MKIRGAILDHIGLPRPYATSAPLTIADLVLAPPGENELLVRVEAAGLCHSDLSVIDGNRVRPVPMLLGHEAAGVVERAGGESDLAVGQRVVLTFLPRCGQCAGCATDGLAPCIPGSAANGAGTLMDGDIRLSREGEPVLHHLGCPASPTTPSSTAARSCPSTPTFRRCSRRCWAVRCSPVAARVLNAGRPRPGQTVAVVGLGGVGMAAVLTALGHDDVHVVGVDPLGDKLGRARALGIHDACTPEEATDRGLKAEVVIEAVGHPAALETAIGLTAPGGRTITVGLPHPDARISLSPLGFVAEGRSLIGSYLGSSVPARDIPRFVQMWRDGRLAVESLVSSMIRLDEINTAMDELADGKAVRQVIEFR